LKGDLQLVHTILKHSPNVNMKDASNRNALFYAINADKGDNADIVLTLVNSGINVNEPEKEGNLTANSPLTLATQKNMRNTVKALLDNGADPNWVIAKDANSALHFAVKNSNIDIIEKLLQKNANLRAINKDNYTPLSLALKLSHTDIYKSLCEEHNKIVKKENEVANTLITEENEHTQQMNNSNTKSKKKKTREIEDSVEKSHYENKSNFANITEEHKINNYVDSINSNVPHKLNFSKGNIQMDPHADTEHSISNTNSNENNLTKNLVIGNNSQIKGTVAGSSNFNNQNYIYVNKKKNPKLELIHRIKEIKMGNLRSKNNISGNYSKYPNTHSSSNLHYGNVNNVQSLNNNNSPYSLEIPFEFNRKVGDSNPNQFNSYISIFNFKII
jgi:ankyrin repeat protein